MTTLEELQQPDERTLIFTPYGLGMGVKMHPDSSARYWSEVAGSLELAPAVADNTRQTFERLRTLFMYGVLCYDAFTVVGDNALLVIEQALADRFLEYYNNKITFVPKKGGDEETVSVTDYEQVFKDGKKRGKWLLRVGSGLDDIPFKGSYADLRTWARHVGLLRGQRNRNLEEILAESRNYVAHSRGFHLVGPNDAIRGLRDLTEIVNQLWGQSTPGGRMYRGPLTRDVVVLAWRKDIGTCLVIPAGALQSATDVDDQWACVVLRAVANLEHVRDSALMNFDARFDVTDFPTDLLWGPGSPSDAADWIDANAPASDTCEYLDRTFALRYYSKQLWLPMRPSVVRALPETERAGRWYVVQADHPGDARLHVQRLIEAGTDPACQESGPCEVCHATSLGSGTYDEIQRLLGTGEPATPPDVATPFAFPHSREVSQPTPSGR